MQGHQAKGQMTGQAKGQTNGQATGQMTDQTADPTTGGKDFYESVLIIGAGPIVIGQACEFDYSGTQACKALREEGIRVILVNSNPATIMTDPEVADATYIEPITPEMVEKIIQIEKPQALLSTVGGQTALNCSLELVRRGVLEKYNVKMIGAKPEAIEKAENRQLFNEAMKRIGLEVPRNATVSSMEEAMKAIQTIGLPAVIRPSFTLGGRGEASLKPWRSLKRLFSLVWRPPPPTRFSLMNPLWDGKSTKWR